MEATIGADEPPLTAACFDPRLRDGGEFAAARHSSLALVSIHASVMEATQGRGMAVMRHDVSIHASVMEATRTRPTLRARTPVSIHASVMEATLARQGAAVA